jgi:hypothetical protein
MPPKIHRPEGARQDREQDAITNNCESDVNGWPRFAGLDGQNVSATSRVIQAFGSFRRTISCVYGAFVARLFRPFRAKDVQGWPFTQGGARRLRRLALPWANLFCPFGAWGFVNAARFLPGMAVPSQPGPSGAIVLTPPKGQ